MITGHLKRSIGLDITDEGLTAEIEPTADYAAYVEYGTRFMNAQPYMKPAYNAQKGKFKSDFTKTCEVMLWIHSRSYSVSFLVSLREKYKDTGIGVYDTFFTAR